MVLWTERSFRNRTQEFITMSPRGQQNCRSRTLVFGFLGRPRRHRAFPERNVFGYFIFQGCTRLVKNLISTCSLTPGLILMRIIESRNFKPENTSMKLISRLMKLAEEPFSLWGSWIAFCWSVSQIFVLFWTHDIFQSLRWIWKILWLFMCLGQSFTEHNFGADRLGIYGPFGLLIKWFWFIEPWHRCWTSRKKLFSFHSC